MTFSLPKEYNSKEAEARWQKHWEISGTYHFLDDLPREHTFVVDTPPPTVSGVLHMGHIFSYTQADILARYQRMAGKDVFYPIGFDDNGLPTERLVEKIKNVRGVSMERQAFVELCREVTLEAEDEFRRLFRSVALSVDWRQEYRTISDEVIALSQASFLDLLQKGHAYRDFRPTYWDWVDQTAIAQAEIENKEMQGTMYDLLFSLEDGTPLTIATTRPELLGACVAVMYHPEDTNAAAYAGKHAVTPLFGVKVPMIADEAVDKEFGSGLVMCCTYGDDTDKEWQRKHSLPRRTLLGLDGRMDATVSSDAVTFTAGQDGATEIATLSSRNCVDFQRTHDSFHQLTDENGKGLKPKQAHAKMVEMLNAEGKILAQKSMSHAVKCAERSGTPIEIIPTHQWFVRIIDKKEALKARGAECEWYPAFMKQRLDQWIDGLKEDWCISRQRFSGVPFPLWYSKRPGEEGKVLLAEPGQLPVDPFRDLPKGYTREEVHPSTDIMDTWATSSITPQINAQALGGESARYKKLFPADLRPQAHEIIRTWAFYTLVKAHLHANTIPWKKLAISGWCLAADKTKMSKSKGNVVTPVALIEDKGADAVRYWTSTSRLGADTAFSEDVLKIGRKLVTKLWNASNFVSLQLQDFTPPASAPDFSAVTEPLDRWILTRLKRAVETATDEFERFEYCDARIAVEDFFWNDFCDNYLELVKERAYARNPSALLALHTCLDAVLRLFAPFVPHVTEEIYSHLFPAAYKAHGSIHARGNWPLATAYPVDEAAEQSGIAALGVLETIRKAKSEAGVSIKYPVATVSVEADTLSLISPLLHDLKSAGNVVGEVMSGPPRVELAKEAA